MNIIYSYSPKNKIAKSSSDNKNNNTENNLSFKSNSDQGKQNNVIDKTQNFKKNENKSENKVISLNIKSNKDYFNLFKTEIFSNKSFKDGPNKNNISFLNTKRIQKITTPVSTKIINSSPFIEKTSLLLKKNNSSAFRNLENEFKNK